MRTPDSAVPADPKYSARRSLILRYHKNVSAGLSEHDLKRASSREGARIFRLLQRKGVPVYILDETTLTRTATFESLLAAVTIAHCLKEGRKKIIFSSGGNLGTALAVYAREAGLQAYSFNPLKNVQLLDKAVFSAKGICLVGVDPAGDTRKMVLEFRRRLMKKIAYDPLVPRMDWRREAFACRGLFILEFMRRSGVGFSAVAQTVSAGFGPLALFSALSGSIGRGGKERLPRFVGVQQAANCYMYRRWSGEKVPYSEDLIVPTLFDRNPHRTFGTYPAISALLKNTGGSLFTIDRAEFLRYISADVLGMLAERGVVGKAGTGPGAPSSGLMALAGVFKAIDSGALRNGPVLVCMTDGAGAVPRAARPAFTVKSSKDLAPLVGTFLGGKCD
jgi:hypothetical protein